MADTLSFPKSSDRKVIYEVIYPQIEAIMRSESDLIANYANLVAALHEAFRFFWVGVYRVKDGELVLRPFQGPIACTRIAFSRGVCGHSYTTGKTVMVPNVDEFPGHIACSSATKSEIVVPIRNSKNEIVGVLDVDSEHLNDFSEVDREQLEKVVGLFSA